MSCCVICLDDTGDILTTNCKHCYHPECLVKWLETNPSYPMCRIGMSLIPHMDKGKQRYFLVQESLMDDWLSSMGFDPQEYVC